MSNSLDIVEYFGPRVAKVKLDDSIVTSLQNICSSADKSMTHRLVGLIKEEVDIFDKVVGDKTVHDQLLKHMNDYMYNIDPGIWEQAINSMDLPTVLELKSAWYNKQVAGEHNPPHHHGYNADVVCVIFTDIKLDTDDSKHYNVLHGEKQTGQLNFLYGDNEQNGFGKSRIVVQPTVGDMYIFPSTLTHYTIPVVGNSVRYSVACNYNITTLVKKVQKQFL